MSLRRSLPSIVLDPTDPRDLDNVNLFLEQHGQKLDIDFTRSIKTTLVEKENQATHVMMAKLSHPLIRYGNNCFVVKATSSNHQGFVQHDLGELVHDQTKSGWTYTSYLSDIETLDKIVESERSGIITLTTLDRLKITRAILIAVAQLHEKGLIHRNLTPQCIKLCYDKNINDWSATIIPPRFKEQENNDPSYQGNPYFISPEIFLWKSVNKSTDIFSIGCMTGELFGSSNYSLEGLLTKYEDDTRLKLTTHNLLEDHYAHDFVNDETKEEFKDELIDFLHGLIRSNDRYRYTIPMALEHLSKLFELIEPADFQNHFRTSNSSR